MQLFECTCVGYTQIYECTVLGGHLTIWQGSAFECDSDNFIRLRHSAYGTGAGVNGECNDGAMVARSVGVSANHYTSMLNITVGHEMINKTIECLHRDIQGNTSTIGQAVLRITEGNVAVDFQFGLSLEFSVYQDPYGPPGDIHVERFDLVNDQLVLSWNQVTNTSQCPAIRYVFTTTNCGSCPNSTTATTVTCISVNASVSVNHTCMFAVQTEVCGHLLGEMSEYLIVNLTEYIQEGEYTCYY